MGFWEDLSTGLDKVSRKINDFGEGAARATRDFSQQQKLKAEIADEKRVINTQYLKIGKQYFLDHKNDADPDAAYAEMFGKIVRAQKNIEEHEEEIAKLKDTGDAARAAAAEAAEAEDAARAAEAEEKSAAGSADADADQGSAQADAGRDIFDGDTAAPAADESDFVDE